MPSSSRASSESPWPKWPRRITAPSTTRPKGMCGIFGIHARDEDVANLTYFGLFALQHRGQESAGIAVGNGSNVDIHRDMGLVNQVFSPAVIGGMKGGGALGHS